MKIRMLAISFLALTSAIATAAPAQKLACQISRTNLNAINQSGPAQPFTLDMSGIKNEGDGPMADLGSLDKVPVNVQLYLSDKASGELTLQINEKTSDGGTIVLASTLVARKGITKLVYRPIGNETYVLLACQRQ